MGLSGGDVAWGWVGKRLCGAEWEEFVWGWEGSSGVGLGGRGKSSAKAGRI